VEVTFMLTGAKAAQFALKGKAHFSGGFSKDVQAGVALHGPSGMEHLTALELDAVPAGGGKSVKGAWDASPRTKIFKPARPAPKGGVRAK
jgi:hypothetical protein